MLQREITNKLAEEALSGFFTDGATVRIDLAEEALSGLTFENPSCHPEPKAKDLSFIDTVSV